MARSYTEALLTDPRAFGLATATPLQRAICRASEGLDLGDTWDYEEVRAGFRGVAPPVTGIPPETMIVLSAIRAAKSTIAAAAAIRMSQRIDLTHVIPGDCVRIPVLSIDKDSAQATFDKLEGMVTDRPLLRSMLVRPPTADTLLLRHPSGYPIEIKVVALAKYGSTVVSRWLGGIIFDEGPLMAGEESVRNLSEARRAVMGRILRGGQEWIVGSPWGAMGPVYDLVQEHQGRPSEIVVVVRAPGPAMNPIHWTPAECAKTQRKDPRAYTTNVLAEFADPEETQFASALVERAMRKTPEVLAPDEHVHYTATIDPATRGNAWTLVVTGHYGFGGPGGATPQLRVALRKQWRGSSKTPLNPDVVLRDIAEICGDYGCEDAYTDQWAVDALRVIAERHNLTLHEIELTGKNRVGLADDLKQQLTLGALELPPDRAMRQDLVGVKKRITVNGYTLVLPKTSDGRHSDYVPPLLLLMAALPEPPEAEEQGSGDDEPDFAIETQGSWSNVFSRLL